MDTNPFDWWYEAQVPTAGVKGYTPEKWNYYTVEHDSNQHTEVEAKQIRLAEVNEWVLGRGLVRSPGFDILIAQHTDDGYRYKPHERVPFGFDHFKSIIKTLALPAQYYHVRTTSGIHCNAVTSRVYKDDDGNISRITHAMRAGHGSVTTASSVWSAAITWNALTGRTTAFVEGLPDEDVRDFTRHIQACSRFLAHPLMLPEILLHMTTTILNERLRIPCEEEFYRYEQHTGLSNLPYYHKISHTAVWNWGLADFQNATTVANRSLTNMAFLRRRFQFTTQVAEQLLSTLAELKASTYKSESVAEVVLHEDEWRQRLRDRILQSQIYEHQTECVQKRIENLNNVLYTVLSQINSKTQAELAKTNLQIAQAVRSDSIPVRTIAYVTLLFLPGALVASVFGTNFFSFDSATNNVVVAGEFWRYWAVTIPFTVFVVLVWGVWNLWEKRKGEGVVGGGLRRALEEECK